MGHSGLGSHSKNAAAVDINVEASARSKSSPPSAPNPPMSIPERGNLPPNTSVNICGAAPQILTDVLGGRLPLSGIDIGGFGALGGLDFDLALASTFMSTAAAFLECDPKPECPIEDTYNFGTGGSSKENSDEKVNNNNIVDKVKPNIRGSAFSAERQLIQKGIESTGIPSNLPTGSFGISAEGANEAINNRVEKLTGIPAKLPEGAFTITPKKKFKLPNISPAL